jgi:hypothetical protein
MRLWLRWLWSLTRNIKELPPGSSELKQLPPVETGLVESGQPTQPGVSSELAPAIEAHATPILLPPVAEVTETSPVIEATAELVPPVSPSELETEVTESGTPDSAPLLPAPVATQRTAKFSETWIRERAGYFSSGRYAPPPAGAESFLAPDLLFRLGIDTQRSLPEAASAPHTPPAPPCAVKPAARLMDDFTTTWDAPPPAPDPSGRVTSVDPLLLTLFLGDREAGPIVPAEATSEYLTEPALLAHAISLRGRLLQHWTSGGAPVTTRQLYDLALQIAQHPGTALLLCHNVTKAFARGGEAIRWRVINRAAGDYSDGQSAYSAAGLPAAFAAPSIFQALFAAAELGIADAGYWYRFFACATAACYAASAQTRMPALSSTPDAEQAARRIVDVGRQLRCGTCELTPAYRGWLWVNAWVFVETANYSRNQAAAHAESRNSLQGVCFGMAQADRSPDSGWRWAVPAVGSASDQIAEWLSPV